MTTFGWCCDHECLERGFLECCEVLLEEAEEERLEAERQHDENTLWCHLALED
jgi:hypothetical protein